MTHALADKASKLFFAIAVCALAFLTGILSSALADPSQPPPQSNEPPRVEIKVNVAHMHFDIEGQPARTPLTLKTGQKYKIIFENVAPAKHEVLLGRHPAANGDGYDENLLGNQPVIISGSVMINNVKRIYEVETNGINEIELEPGNRLAIYFTLPESAHGEWEMGCFMPGHHAAGMHLPVFVD